METFFENGRFWHPKRDTLYARNVPGKKQKQANKQTNTQINKHVIVHGPPWVKSQNNGGV